MSVSDTILQALVGGGVLAGLGETWRWFFGGGRKHAKIDNAKAIEAMAVELLTPLNDQVHRTQATVKTLEEKITDLTQDLETVLAWALAVKAILDSHGIDYPPVPNTSQKH